MRCLPRAPGAPPLSVSAILVVSVVLSLLAPALAAARVFRCHDGIPPSATSPFCDADEQCDGVCTFVFCTGREFACKPDNFVVPVGEKWKARGIRGHSFILRCRHHPRGVPCPTTTTTMPTPSTCSSGADCRVEGNPCMPGFCGGGRCQPDCACIAPDFTAACSPEQAIHCPNPDCHPLLGDPCIHCGESGLCVTFPDCD
jgi:hypothetical protein